MSVRCACHSASVPRRCCLTLLSGSLLLHATVVTLDLASPPPQAFFLVPFSLLFPLFISPPLPSPFLTRLVPCRLQLRTPWCRLGVVWRRRHGGRRLVCRTASRSGGAVSWRVVGWGWGFDGGIARACGRCWVDGGPRLAAAVALCVARDGPRLRTSGGGRRCPTRSVTVHLAATASGSRRRRWVVCGSRCQCC